MTVWYDILLYHTMGYNTTMFTLLHVRITALPLEGQNIGQHGVVCSKNAYRKLCLRATTGYRTTSAKTGGSRKTKIRHSKVSTII